MKEKKKDILLSELLHGLTEVRHVYDRKVTGLVLDSRIVQPGDIFLACVGAKVDGHTFIEEARRRGAVAVLCEKLLPNLGGGEDFPLIVVPKLCEKLGQIAAKFYDYPARKLTMIGVTGTNGKTSITNYVAEILTRLNIPCGIIGTLGAGIYGNLSIIPNTTPDPVTLNRLLYEFSNAGAQAVAMEVSSHGLARHRVADIDFTIGVFTNLTRDHLDYHGTLEAYGATKKKLFLEHNIQYALLNTDDDFGYTLATQLTPRCQVYAYTTTNSYPPKCLALIAQDIKLASLLMEAQVSTPWGQGELQTKLLGRFNISNLLAVLGVLGIMRIDLQEALAAIAELHAVDGRMQVIHGNAEQPVVIVDYAHTPDALENVLKTARQYCNQGKLRCVFGCGGERDRGKRPLMGKIAELYSDHIILTNDNPRSENQEQIIQDILSGFTCPWAVEIEYDRAVATSHAVHSARPGDVIVIAGKGHECYQLIGDKKLEYSDQNTVKQVLQQYGK